MPAHRVNWYERLAATEADVLILDLEDGVPESDKQSARRSLLKFHSHIAPRPHQRLFLRINGKGSNHYEADLSLTHQLAPIFSGLLLPKVKSPEEIADLESKKPSDWEIIPTIELLEGEAQMDKIIASPAIQTIQFGESGDYSVDFGFFERRLDAMKDPVAQEFAIRAVKTCKAMKKNIIDGVFLNLKNSSGLRKRCQWAFRLGFDGKAAIHPKQVAIINRWMFPTPAELHSAKQIIEIYKKSAKAGGFVAFHGGFITPPIYKAAQIFLKKYGA